MHRSRNYPEIHGLTPKNVVAPLKDHRGVPTFSA
jgi:hypothetical protein